MNKFLTLFTLFVIVLFGSTSFSQETKNYSDLTLDDEGRLNPVWTSIENGYATGRYLLPGASTAITCKPIDVRGMDYINFQLTKSNPANTVSSETAALTIYGSVLGSANASIGGATYMFDSDIATLPIALIPTDATATSQTSSKLKRVDVRGLAWIQPYIADASVNATKILYYGGQKRREYLGR